jgi:hypothetical protein
MRYVCLLGLLAGVCFVACSGGGSGSAIIGPDAGDAGGAGGSVDGGTEGGLPPLTCDGVTCSGHGKCQDQAGQIACVCDQGYVSAALTCVASSATWFPIGDSELVPRSQRPQASVHFGGVSETGAEVRDPALAMDPSGQPFVAWSGLTGLSLRTWTGSAWQDVGDLASSGQASIAVRSDGTPVVAWSSSSGVFLKSWDGSAWQELGGSGSGNGLGKASTAQTTPCAPGLALDSQGNPLVAFASQESAASYVLLRRWDGTGWTDLGGSGAAPGLASEIHAHCAALALDSQGQPYVAFIVQSTDGYAVVHYNGTAWEPVGGTSGKVSGFYAGGAATLLVDQQDHPVLFAPAQTLIGGNFSAAYVVRWDGASWQGLGGSSQSSGLSASTYGNAGHVAGQIASDGSIWALWPERDGQGVDSLHVKQWDGTVWNNVASPTIGHESISQPHAALAPNGQVTVAWAERAGADSNVRFAQWSGTDWTELGQQAVGHGISGDVVKGSKPRLLFDSSGLPTVLYEGYDTTVSAVHGARWSGATWDPLPILQEADKLEAPAVALGPTGQLLVASQKLKDGPSMGKYEGWRVDLWDGAKWSNLEDPTAYGEPSVAFTSTGTPVLAGVVAGGVDVVSWNGTKWAPFGADAEVGPAAGYDNLPALAIGENDHPVVIWRSDTGVQLLKFDGTSWSGLGSSGSGPGLSADGTEPRLALDASGNPVVAFLGKKPDGGIVVTRWNGTTWTPVGTPQGTSDQPSEPSLALLPSGDPVLAWRSDATGVQEIYVKYWTGNAWAEIDGSASGGGVSNSFAGSVLPSLAVAGSLICVSWDEGGGVLMRCTERP